MCVCLDPKDLNAAIKRTYHRTPTVEEISHRLEGAQIFSKLDVKSGYWAIGLDQESSSFTSFNAPSGRYRFKRMPLGICVAQDAFQEKMDAILSGCKGTMHITDDILVFGKSLEDHDNNLHNLMKRAGKCGLVCYPEKCTIRTREAKFFGMIYTPEGIQPDPNKTEEIANLPSPKCVKDLQQFLGMVQYLASYTPNLSEKTDILRELTKKDIQWLWTPTHEDAYQAIKKQICNTVMLSYYNPALDTKIQVDASKKGLGAALIQIDKEGKEKIIALPPKH